MNEVKAFKLSWDEISEKYNQKSKRFLEEKFSVLRNLTTNTTGALGSPRVEFRYQSFSRFWRLFMLQSKNALILFHPKVIMRLM